MARFSLSALMMCAALPAACSSASEGVGNSPSPGPGTAAGSERGIDWNADDIGPAPTPLPRNDVPSSASGHEFGTASWYGREHEGRRTASGAVFDRHKLTAAHPLLPLGTRIRVVNVANGKAVVVVINDRGPFILGRILDLSEAAAERIGLRGSGTGLVEITIIEKRIVSTPYRASALMGRL